MGNAEGAEGLAGSPQAFGTLEGNISWFPRAVGSSPLCRAFPQLQFLVQLHALSWDRPRTTSLGGEQGPGLRGTSALCGLIRRQTRAGSNPVTCPGARGTLPNIGTQHRGGDGWSQFYQTGRFPYRIQRSRWQLPSHTRLWTLSHHGILADGYHPSRP